MVEPIRNINNSIKEEYKKMKRKTVRVGLFGLAAVATIVAPHYVFAACDDPYCPPMSYSCPLGCWPVESWLSTHCYYGTQGECCECKVDFFKCDCDDGYEIVFRMAPATYYGWYCRQITMEQSTCTPVPPPPGNP